DQVAKQVRLVSPLVDTEVQGATASRPGSERSWLVSYYPVRDYQGTILGVNTVVQEVTERKRTEERFRLVVESMPNALLMVNAEGDIVLVNSPCERFFGYRREELLGRPVEVLVPERFRPKHPGYRADFFASPSVRPMGGAASCSAGARTAASSRSRLASRPSGPMRASSSSAPSWTSPRGSRPRRPGRSWRMPPAWPSWANSRHPSPTRSTSRWAPS